MANRSLFIHHHLGMGDHIICNGLVRSLLNDGKCYAEVYVFCKQRNAPRVARMFDDEPRIKVLVIPDSENEVLFVNGVIYSYGITDFIRCNFGTIDNLMSMGLVSNFDEAFYVGTGIPFENKWSKFNIRRDKVEEQRVLNKLNPNMIPFMFVHDDPSRGYSINPVNPNNLLVVRNDPSEDLFNMIGVLESASEIHCIESSISNLIEFIPNITCPLHMYASMRPDSVGRLWNATTKKNWIVT